MAQRHRQLWTKGLIGLVFALAIADVLALIFVVTPLRASQQARADAAGLAAQPTRSTVDQALILPTRDPRKPWVTRTPQPTITPWLNHTATPAPAATAPPMSANAPAPGARPGVPDAAASPVPSPAASAFRRTGASSPTPTSPATITPASTPATVNVLPTATSQPPSGTPGPTQSPDPSQLPPPKTREDEAQFQVYVRDHYNTIDGQPLVISAVTFDTTEARLPRITVRVAGDDMGTGFGAQPAFIAQDYGRRLLDDAKHYFDNQSCAITVISESETVYAGACMANPSWCTARALSEYNNGWSIAWIYVLGTSIDGSDSVQTWN